MAHNTRSRQNSLRTSTMLNKHAKAQSGSLSPVRGRKNDLAQKPSKDNRRVTVADGYTIDRDRPAQASRVEKSTAQPRQRRHHSNAPGLVQKFDEALDAKHDELADWAEQTLLMSEERCNEELDNIVEYFNRQMTIFEGLQGTVDKPFGDQRLVISTRQDENGEWQQVEATIADRMQYFHDILAQEEGTLNILWQEWGEVQAEMICYAVEILGQENVDLEEHNLSDTLMKQIHSAIVKNKDTEKRYAEAGQAVVGLETDMVALCNDTSKTMKAQQKTWRAERKKMLDNIKKAMEDFEKIR